MDTEMGESQETKKIIWFTNWRINAESNISKESMIDSYEIKNSVFEWLNIIEMKFVDDGMLLTMKITLTSWQYKNTSIKRTNGGFIQISKVLIPCHWDIVLISSKHIVYHATITTRSRKEPYVLTYSYKHKQWQLAQFIFYMVELARILVVFIQFRKSRRRWAKSWVNGVTRYL